jgi:uncharacterized protein
VNYRKRGPLQRAMVFAFGVLALSTFASVFITDNSSPAALLFVMSPTLISLVLRATGDGWSDSGLRLGGQLWHYSFAVTLFPVLAGLTLAAGAATGHVEIGSDFATEFAIDALAQLLPSLVFAFGEEWGWRGYLEPRLDEAQVGRFQRHLIVGLLWAVWHVPYILALGAHYTALPLVVQLPLFHIAVVMMAFIWGPLRTATDSAWPAILGHGVANAVAFPLLNPILVKIESPLWFAARPEGLVTLSGLTLAAFWLYRTSAGAHECPPTTSPYHSLWLRHRTKRS